MFNLTAELAKEVSKVLVRLIMMKYDYSLHSIFGHILFSNCVEGNKEKRNYENKHASINESIKCAVYRENYGVCNWSTAAAILDLNPFFPPGAGRLRQIQDGVRFLGFQQQRSGATLVLPFSRLKSWRLPVR